MSEEAKKAWINPRVHFELRLSEVNRLNNLIDKAEPKAVVETDNGELYKKYECPVCGRSIWNIEQDIYCRRCGQRFDTENISL